MDISTIKSTVISTSSDGIVIQVTIPFSNKSMLSSEESIQVAVNSAGALATEHALSNFDTDGTPIILDNKKYTSKGKVLKEYQTPYGVVSIERHVYQSNLGGATFCPLDQEARIIVGSTPRFSKTISSKYSQMSALAVQTDLRENHCRNLTRSYIQNISESVACIKAEKKWTYSMDVDKEDVRCVGISLDGTCLLMSTGGYKQAMVGSISLYDHQGERILTRYTASPPESGKSQFYELFSKEIELVKKQYPTATYVGVADGAVDNWSFLGKYAECQVLDFFHATEYLAKVSHAAFKRPFEGKEWLEDACSRLKRGEKGAEELLKEMICLKKKKIKDDKKEEIQKSITYFTNHSHQMCYWEYLEKNLPIGSGVIEAACKVIIKQRMGNSGMKWSDLGAKTVLTLRCSNESSNVWKLFWKKIDRYGK